MNSVANNVKKTQIDYDTDVAIIGGGLVGLSFALLLAKELSASHETAHKRITVIETRDLKSLVEKKESVLDVRTTAVSPNTAELYQQLGLWDDLLPNISIIEEVLVSDRGQWGKASFSLQDNQEQPVGYVINNTALVTCLVKALLKQKNINFIAPASVKKLVPLSAGMQIHLQARQDDNSAEKIIKTDLSVVVDGANSALREHLGIDAQVTDYHQHALITNITYTEPHKGRAFERFTIDGPLAILPLGDTHLSKTSALVWTRPNENIEQTMALSDEAFLAQLHERFGYGLGQFSSVGVRHCFPLKLVLSKEQIRSSCVLLGNALHSMHPVAGQGFNLAIRDCIQLTSVLCNRGQFCHLEDMRLGDLKRLSAYEDAQKKDQRATVLISHQFNQLFSKKSKMIASARTLGLIGIDMLGGAKHEFFSHMMGRGHSQPELLIRRKKTAIRPRNYSQ